MKVTILGGGNIGSCLLAEIKNNTNFDVWIYTSKAKLFSNVFRLENDEDGTSYEVHGIKATDSLTEATVDADMVICTQPAFLRKGLIQHLKSTLRSGTMLGFFPGYGGAELACRDLINNGVIVFGLQKVPYVARTKAVGSVAGLLSKKTEVFLAALPHSKTEAISHLVENMLRIKTTPLHNYLAATLLPGNPLLHTSGSYVYLHNYSKGHKFSDQIYYYQSWTDEHSEMICKMSDEMMEICDALPLDLSEVDSIQKYYESATPKCLTKKFHSIPSFEPLKLPMKSMEGGYVADFTSRFFTEDIPFGLCILKGLAQLVNVRTPNIDQVIQWYQQISGKSYFDEHGNFGSDISETAIPQLYGIQNAEQLAKFYQA